MARYIDVDKVKNLFCGRCTTPERHGVTIEQCRAEEKENLRYRHKWCLIMRLIDQVETAEVAEVKHGKWEFNAEDIIWGNSLKRRNCTNCGSHPFFDKEKFEFLLSDYCPNCGARMDGKKK